MGSPYRRRKPSILRNLWVYRRFVAAAAIVGMLLWFIWANNEQVTVAFPFGLGRISRSVGVIILASALLGSIAGLLVSTLYGVIRHRRAARSTEAPTDRDDREDDLPPPDYAARTGEGLSGSPLP